MIRGFGEGVCCGGGVSCTASSVRGIAILLLHEERTYVSEDDWEYENTASLRSEQCKVEHVLVSSLPIS